MSEGENSSELYSEELKKDERRIIINSDLNGKQPLFAFVGYYDLKTIIGRILTIIDASFQDKEQRKAVKDLIKREFWCNWVDHLDKTEDSLPTGIPMDN